MNVRFVAGFSPIVDSLKSERDFYERGLGLPVQSEGTGDYSTIELPGVKHFGLWTLADAARSTFGSEEWPAATPRPQATLELEVDDVFAAADELIGRGLQLLQEPKTEPWGQITARLLSPEGLLVGITYTPALRDE